MNSDRLLWLDQIFHGDALDVMSRMPTGLVQVAVTSPPYNLRNSSGNGMKWGKPSGNWSSAKLQEGYERYMDNLPRDEYVAWQRNIITAMLDLLPPEGAIFYNHKGRVQAGLLQDQDDIMAGFPVRQIIVWNRMGGFNHNPGYLIPSHELIYLIAKPRFVLSATANSLTDVWTIKPDRQNPHPAPFPIELARRAISCTDAEVVLDPFIGSGTTGIAARSLERHYVGIDQSERYCQMARERIQSGVFTTGTQGALPLTGASVM